MKKTVRNTGTNPTFVHSARGAITLEIGQSVTADFVDAQVEAMDGDGALELSEPTGDEPEAVVVSPKPVEKKKKKDAKPTE